MSEPTTTLEEFIEELEKKKKEKINKKQIPLLFEETFSRINKNINTKRGQKKEWQLSETERTTLINLPVRNRVGIETLINRVCRFVSLFEDSRIKSKAVAWNSLHYAVAMSFLSELVEETLSEQIERPFIITNLSDKGFSENEQ